MGYFSPFFMVDSKGQIRYSIGSCNQLEYKMNLRTSHFLLILFGLLLLAVLAPIAIIWSLNAVFPALAIPYTLETWAGTFILASVITGKRYK